jgi:hypothetical protein
MLGRRKDGQFGTAVARNCIRSRPHRFSFPTPFCIPLVSSYLSTCPSFAKSHHQASHCHPGSHCHTVRVFTYTLARSVSMQRPTVPFLAAPRSRANPSLFLIFLSTLALNHQCSFRATFRILILAIVPLAKVRTTPSRKSVFVRSRKPEPHLERTRCLSSLQYPKL